MASSSHLVMVVRTYGGRALACMSRCLVMNVRMDGICSVYIHKVPNMNCNYYRGRSTSHDSRRYRWRRNRFNRSRFIEWHHGVGMRDLDEWYSTTCFGVRRACFIFLLHSVVLFLYKILNMFERWDLFDSVVVKFLIEMLTFLKPLNSKPRIV